jgi:hypothetical protein
MSMLDVHADALDTGGALYHEFLLRFRKDHRVVYGIVEGKDDPLFYRGLIEHYLPSGWEIDLLVAGNKSKVLSAEQDFDWSRFNKSRICFFVDRDLSDFTATDTKSKENVYVTDGYTIENELANFAAIKRVMQEILNVTEISHGELLLMERSFNDNIKVFSGNMTAIMAQIILWQKNGGKPSLDNIVPKDLFEFRNGSLKPKGDFDVVANRVGYAAQKVNIPPSLEAELAIATQDFIILSGPERLIRGKYVAWFVVEQCLHFHSRIQDYCKSYAVPPKVRVTLGQANAIALVANRIRCPKSLEKFIKSTYGYYISGGEKEIKIDEDRETKGIGLVWEKLIRATKSVYEKLLGRWTST